MINNVPQNLAGVTRAWRAFVAHTQNYPPSHQETHEKKKVDREATRSLRSDTPSSGPAGEQGPFEGEQLVMIGLFIELQLGSLPLTLLETICKRTCHAGVQFLSWVPPVTLSLPVNALLRWIDGARSSRRLSLPKK